MITAPKIIRAPYEDDKMVDIDKMNSRARVIVSTERVTRASDKAEVPMISGLNGSVLVDYDREGHPRYPMFYILTSQLPKRYSICYYSDSTIKITNWEAIILPGPYEWATTSSEVTRLSYPRLAVSVKPEQRAIFPLHSPLTLGEVAVTACGAMYMAGTQSAPIIINNAFDYLIVDDKKIYIPRIIMPFILLKAYVAKHQYSNHFTLSMQYSNIIYVDTFFLKYGKYINRLMRNVVGNLIYSAKVMNKKLATSGNDSCILVERVDGLADKLLHVIRPEVLEKIATEVITIGNNLKQTTNE